MKRILLIIALIGGISATGFSQQRSGDGQQQRQYKRQQHRSPEERARQYTDAMDRRLNLTDKQEREIYQLELKNARKSEKMHQEMRKRQEKEMRARRSDREASEKKLNRILTDDQRAAYNKLRDDRKERLHSRHARMKKQMRKQRDPNGSFRKRG